MSHVLSTGGGQALMDPADTLLLLLDHQSGLFQTVKDISVTEPRANTTALAKLATFPPAGRLAPVLRHRWLLCMNRWTHHWGPTALTPRRTVNLPRQPHTHYRAQPLEFCKPTCTADPRERSYNLWRRHPIRSSAVLVQTSDPSRTLLSRWVGA
jgi:hypothetical protein